MKKTIGFSEMSSHNRFTILNLIREKGTISRADLVKTTSLTAPSVSRITAGLMKQDLILEDGIGLSTGGRKPVLYRFNPDARYAAAIAIVRERVDFALLDFTPKILESKSIPLPGPPHLPETIDAVVEMIIDYINSLSWCRDKLVGAGISIPGLVDIETGAVRYSSPMGWHNVELKRWIQEKIDLPVHIDNSIMATTIAENMFGKERKSRNFIYLYAGMGIGIGIVINGRPYRGAKYSSMEIGHTVICLEGKKCSCGKQGCWELLAGTPSLLERYAEKMKGGSKDKKPVDLQHIVDQYRKGSPEAVAALEETLHYFAIGLSNIVNIFNPHYILLSGWPVEFPDTILPKIKSKVNEYSMEGMGESLQLERCSFNHDNELLIGAGSIALHEFIYIDISGRRR